MVSFMFVTVRLHIYTKSMRRDVFQAIADPTRREIINLIAHQKLNLNAVADKFSVSRPAISKHIKILTECGLISIKQQGREGYWPTAAQQPKATKHDIEHGAWYNQVHKIILSRTMKGKQIPNTTIVSENLSASIGKLKAEGGKDVVIFGSPSAAHSLMAENLI